MPAARRAHTAHGRRHCWLCRYPRHRRGAPTWVHVGTHAAPRRMPVLCSVGQVVVSHRVPCAAAARSMRWRGHTHAHRAWQLRRTERPRRRAARGGAAARSHALRHTLCHCRTSAACRGRSQAQGFQASVRSTGGWHKESGLAERVLAPARQRCSLRCGRRRANAARFCLPPDAQAKTPADNGGGGAARAAPTLTALREDNQRHARGCVFPRGAQAARLLAFGRARRESWLCTTEEGAGRVVFFRRRSVCGAAVARQPALTAGR
mmetsp:Transcript_773/g.2085  ORF Transcript_773/g.2085 Transcript_773/m.2085 type:complete len:264 (-) Transcript_773:9-800(-)